MLDGSSAIELTPESAAAILRINKTISNIWTPPENIKVSDYAKERMRIVTGPRRGLFIPECYQYEPMDSIHDPEMKWGTVLKSVQSGVSTLLLAQQAWASDVMSWETAVVLPQQTMSMEYSKDRLVPTVESGPLKDKWIIATNRKTGSTTRKFRFTNGAIIHLVSAQTPAELRSFSANIVWLDERSAFELSKEGDPGDIVQGRGEQFEDFKVFEVSTPKHPTGFDPTENSFLLGSQGYWHVPCYNCNFMQVLKFRDPDMGPFRLIYEKEHGEVIFDSVYYQCEKCTRKIYQHERVPMINAGEYQHKFPNRRRRRSWHISGLMPTVKFGQWFDICEDWEASHKDQLKLKTFFNLKLGMSIPEQGNKVGASFLRGRLEDYPDRIVPKEAAVVLATCDVQLNRLESTIWAISPKKEMWLIDSYIFGGSNTDNTKDEYLWLEMDEWLKTPLQHELTGKNFYIDVVGIDIGYAGSLGQARDFISARQPKVDKFGNVIGGRVDVPIYGLKGTDTLAKKGLWAQKGHSKGELMSYFVVASHLVKTHALYSLLKSVDMDYVENEGGELIYKPTPGQVMENFVHLPIWMSEEQLKQLSEVKYSVVYDKLGKDSVVWAERTRNEVWDMFYMAHALFWILSRTTHLSLTKYADLEALVVKHCTMPSTTPVVKKTPNASFSIDDITL